MNRNDLPNACLNNCPEVKSELALGNIILDGSEITIQNELEVWREAAARICALAIGCSGPQAVHDLERPNIRYAGLRKALGLKLDISVPSTSYKCTQLSTIQSGSGYETAKKLQ